jgi:hypothetical protein
MGTMGLEHSPTERELLQAAQSATGLPPPPPPERVLGLNLVAAEQLAVYVCRPTLMQGISIILNPNDAAALAALGDVDLVLDVTHGGISFSNTDGQL